MTDPFLLRPEAPEPRNRGRNRNIVAGGAAFVTAATLLALYSLTRSGGPPEDFEGTGSGTVTIEIRPGQTAWEIAETLREAGVVAKAGPFIRVVEEREKTGSLRPGHYKLARQMPSSLALDRLLAKESRIVRRVTIPEGLRAAEALTRLAQGSGIALRKFQSAAKTELGLPAYAKGNVEGFLFPATYEVEPTTTARELLASMVATYRRTAERIGLEKSAEAGHLTPMEALTAASIIQAEGGRDADYPKIARVIYNRISRGGKLEMDTTVLYAQKRRTLKVSEQDTKVVSPYNTYRHRGLPPGPIGSPGEKALMAALKPAKGTWYWFVTTDPARRITKFTDSEAEFVKYREELNRNLGIH